MSSSAASAASAATASTTAPANSTVAGTGQTAGVIESTQTISSLEDLKNISPTVYNQMLQSVGMTICQDMQREQSELAKIEEEARQENSSS